MSIEFKQVGRYSEERCSCCGECDWGEFAILPNDYKICPLCLDKITKEIKVNEYRKSLERGEK